MVLINDGLINLLDNLQLRIYRMWGLYISLKPWCIWTRDYVSFSACSFFVVAFVFVCLFSSGFVFFVLHQLYS